MPKSHKQLLANLIEALEEGHKPSVEIAFNALVFRGAGVSEPRGVSDAGLSPELLERVFWALPAMSTWRGPMTTALTGVE